MIYLYRKIWKLVSKLDFAAHGKNEDSCRGGGYDLTAPHVILNHSPFDYLKVLSSEMDPAESRLIQ